MMICLPGVVVQLVRIPACHAGGRGFESRPYRKKSDLKKSLFLFSELAPHNSCILPDTLEDGLRCKSDS